MTTLSWVSKALEKERAWRDTVDDMLSVCHMVASDDPRESINRLIDWNVSVALDPSVSSAAEKLVMDERQRCLELVDKLVRAVDAYDAINAIRNGDQP